MGPVSGRPKLGEVVARPLNVVSGRLTERDTIWTPKVFNERYRLPWR